MIISILIFFIVVFLIFVSEKPKFFRRILISLMKFIKFFKNKSKKIENNYKFYDLSPEDGLEEKACGKLLKFGLENEKVLNIAVTGPYGSGKSSFLKSFESKNVNYNYLNISLASFDGSIGNDKNTKNKIEKIIEENILQQIIYKESADKLPNSRIKRIKEISITKFTMNFLLFFLWINSFYLKFGKPVWWNKLINLDDFEKFDKLQSLILILGAFYLVYSLAKKFGINKIVIKALDNEIELGNNKETSVFYKYLDEIIYFFKKTKYDVVFFEDIDRFENINVDLFTKLRELNGLLNSSDDIKRKIKFVYAVKDDLFENEGKEDSHKLRTKFFDLIVPIIPVVNYSNSKEELKVKLWNNYLEREYKNELVTLENELKSLEKLSLSEEEFKKQNSKNVDWKKEIEIAKEKEYSLLLRKTYLKTNENNCKNGIKNFALYIDDMRIINNIVNEFIIYRENLNKKESEGKLDDVKMIAFIIFKNLYPKDFSDLHIRKGLVYEGLSSKDKYIDRIKVRKSNLELKIENFGNEHLSDLESLRFEFLNKIFKEDTIIKVNSKSILKLVKNENLFLTLNGECRIDYINDKYEYKEINIDFDNYNQRKSIINTKLKEKEEKYRLELEELTKEITKANENSIKDLCNRIDTSKIFSTELMNKPFLVYLLKEEKICKKDYYTYISYFYEGDLSFNDRDFLLALRGGKWGLEEYKIDNPKNVIDELDIEEFDKIEILHYDLIKYIIFHNDYKDKMELVLKLINNELEEYVIESAVGEKILIILDRADVDENDGHRVIHYIFMKINNLWSEILDNDREPKKYFLQMFRVFNTNELRSFMVDSAKNETGLFINGIIDTDFFDELLIKSNDIKKIIDIFVILELSKNSETKIFAKIIDFLLKNNDVKIENRHYDSICNYEKREEIKNKLKKNVLNSHDNIFSRT